MASIEGGKENLSLQAVKGVVQEVSDEIKDDAIETINGFPNLSILEGDQKAKYEAFTKNPDFKFLQTIDSRHGIIAYKNKNDKIVFTVCAEGKFFKSGNIKIALKEYSTADIKQNQDGTFEVNLTENAEDPMDIDTAKSFTATIKYKSNGKFEIVKK